MGVSNRILVEHGQKTAILQGLTDMFATEARPWTVTIRPSRIALWWTIEVAAPGRFWAFTAGPEEHDAASIVGLVKAALGAELGAPQSQE